MIRLSSRFGRISKQLKPAPLSRQLLHVSRPYSALCASHTARSFSFERGVITQKREKIQELGRRHASTAGSPEAAAVVSEGDTVSIHYKGTLKSGDEFDSSFNRNEPLGFKVGGGQMLPAFDTMVRGLAVGEKKTFTLTAKEAYGEVDPKAVMTFPLDRLPPDVTPGTQLSAEGGGTAVVISVNSEAKTAEVDLNHPLAGEALTFAIEVMSITPKGPGVVIETIKEGDGKTFPNRGDTLEMHYTGTLKESGKQFDCSRSRGQSFKFTIGVGQVIEGWDEGVMKMSLGQQAKLIIPSDMGYGARGAGGDIPPNADLVFDVELLKIEPR